MHYSQKQDVRTKRVKVLNMAAQTFAEENMLSALCDVMSEGGLVRVVRENKKDVATRFYVVDEEDE